MLEIYNVLILGIFILLFGVATYAISWHQSNKFLQNKNFYLLANRQIPYWQSSMSIAASWIWAPAFFISTQQAYFNGWQGLLWFIIPNVLCLILFSFFADNIRQKYPNGFTLSDIMGTNYSPRVQYLYWCTLVGVIVCALAVQLLAGGMLLSKLLGIPFWILSILLATIPLGYSLSFGLKSSVLTDMIKMFVIIVVGIVLIPVVLSNLGGITVIIQGLGGVSTNHFTIFSENSLSLALTFGIPTTIGLLSGPFGDQSFWQRAFATESSVVKKSFITGALIFSIVPIIMGLLGFAAAGAHIPISSKQFVNLDAIMYGAGVTGVILFLLIIVSALTSIIDSKLCAISSIVGHDISNKFNINSVVSAKISMVVIIIIAIFISNIPNLQILHLFLFYGTLRSSTFIITILTLLGKTLPELGVFYGILTAIFIGLPIFAIGNILGNTLLILSGSIATLLLPIITIKLIQYYSAV